MSAPELPEWWTGVLTCPSWNRTVTKLSASVFTWCFESRRIMLSLPSFLSRGAWTPLPVLHSHHPFGFFPCLDLSVSQSFTFSSLFSHSLSHPTCLSMPFHSRSCWVSCTISASEIRWIASAAGHTQTLAVSLGSLSLQEHCWGKVLSTAQATNI